MFSKCFISFDHFWTFPKFDMSYFLRYTSSCTKHSCWSSTASPDKSRLLSAEVIKINLQEATDPKSWDFTHLFSHNLYM